MLIIPDGSYSDNQNGVMFNRGRGVLFLMVVRDFIGNELNVHASVYSEADQEFHRIWQGEKDIEEDGIYTYYFGPPVGNDALKFTEVAEVELPRAGFQFEVDHKDAQARYGVVAYEIGA